MNEKFYIRLTGIVLALSVAMLVLGSLAFVILKTVIDPMVFSDF